MSKFMSLAARHGTVEAVRLPRAMTVQKETVQLGNSSQGYRHQVSATVSAYLVVEDSFQGGRRDVPSDVIAAMANHVFGEFLGPLDDLLLLAYELGVDQEMVPKIAAIMTCMKNAKPMGEETP